jgi:uncharacterized membrane protein
MRRYLSIDILRGVAIILMIQVHFVENLSPRESPSGWLYDSSILLGSFPAPFFTFVFGLSYALWVRKQESLRRRDEDITKVALRRGLFLFAVGIAFNFFVWLPEETFNWDILTLIGTSFLFLAFARKLPAPVLALICVMVLLASPLLRVVGDFSAYWQDDAYTYDFTLRDVLFGFVANGYFPVFPWIIFPIAGFVSGDLVFRRGESPDSKLRGLCVLGVIFLALSGLGVAVGSSLPTLISQHYANGPTEFPASTEYVLAMLGFTILGLVLLHRWVDRKDNVAGNGRLIIILGRFSSFSLTVYVFHQMVILWPLWIYGAWTDAEDPTVFWRRAMSTPMAIALATAFIVACYFVLGILENYKKYSLESLMRWICD